jgi:hypothetical protein
MAAKREAQVSFRLPRPGEGPRPQGAAAGSPKSRRKYPRNPLGVRARLSLADDVSRGFEASLPTTNVSIGGLFLESSFFLKLGTRLLVELTLPPRGQLVKVKGEVVRVESQVKGGSSGFAVRFTDFLDGSEVVLATHFLSPVLRDFVQRWAKQADLPGNPEVNTRTMVELLSAWELHKAVEGGDVWALAAGPGRP